MKSSNPLKKINIRWQLVLYDCLIYISVAIVLIGYHKGSVVLNIYQALNQCFLAAMIILVCRLLLSIYSQVWRYGGVSAYLKLVISDGCAFVIYYFLQRVIPVFKSIEFTRCLSLVSINLLIDLFIRMVYRYAYKNGGANNLLGKMLRFFLKIFSFGKVTPVKASEVKKINVAIVGAGSVGVTLSSDLLSNAGSPYAPAMFIDSDPSKINREISNIPVMPETEISESILKDYEIQEVVIAIPTLSVEERKRMYNFYKRFGLKVKTYDYPTLDTAGSGRRQMREFDAEELLFRKQLNVVDERTKDYYKGKTVLVTGGGGSIGSEIGRQVASFGAERLVIVDIYENGAYDLQQELKIRYKNSFKVNIEIVSVTDREGLERVFSEYHPDIVINAAAHKHVPLMEKNCIEAVYNNVFGTLNSVELSEKYHVQHFIQVSTDKAVNPTNIMGATKRMCEFIVMSHAKTNTAGTVFTATRFGNVLGSAGSVIPLFKRQIASGGPVTITDKRIIRYFMTIPEASQLVLTSGAMAKNGELFVLDMGQPVKILDLAESMIRLAGYTPYVDMEIIETGLRPGEKLYEELLMASDTLTKTDNEMIFIEAETPLTDDELEIKLEALRTALKTNSDSEVRHCLVEQVPTFKTQSR